jgi:Flp pilus assembly protein TadB
MARERTDTSAGTGAPSWGEVARFGITASVGLGMLIMVLAPFAIPILVLAAVFAIPLLLPVLALALVAGIVAVPVLLVRRLTARPRRSERRREPELVSSSPTHGWSKPRQAVR